MSNENKSVNEPEIEFETDIQKKKNHEKNKKNKKIFPVILVAGTACAGILYASTIPHKKHENPATTQTTQTPKTTPEPQTTPASTETPKTTKTENTAIKNDKKTENLETEKKEPTIPTQKKTEEKTSEEPVKMRVDPEKKEDLDIPLQTEKKQENLIAQAGSIAAETPKTEEIKPTLPETPEIKEENNETEASDPTSPKLVDNHWILQASDPGIALYRINPSTNSDVPITYAITKYDGWNVACESRESKKSCFSTAHQTANKATLSIRIGAASRLATPKNPDYGVTTTPIESGKDYRYILDIETPPQLPPQTRVTVTTDSAIGSSPATNRCDKNGCHVSFYVTGDPSILDAGKNNEGSLTVTININASAYAWIFPTQGLTNAMKRTVREMNMTANTPSPGAHLPH